MAETVKISRKERPVNFRQQSTIRADNLERNFRHADDEINKIYQVLGVDGIISQASIQTVVSGGGVGSGGNFDFTSGAKITVLRTSPANKTIALTTDTDSNIELFYWDTSAWYKIPFNLKTETSSPDMGIGSQSSLIGYGENYISDKLISQCLIGGNDRNVENAIRTTTSGTFQIYLNGVWNDIVINFRFREDSNGANELEHKPIGFDFFYEVMSGNSDILDPDGNPIIQQYTADMGIFKSPLEVDGGTF